MLDKFEEIILRVLIITPQRYIDYARLSSYYV
jgi:hypothetical protein